MSTNFSDQVSITVVAATAGTDDAKTTEWTRPHAGRVTGIRFVPDRAVTANDTNYADISVEIGGTEIASEVTTTADTGSLVKNTPIDLALTADGADLEVSSGTDIEGLLTKVGTGVAIGGEFIVTVKYDRIGAG